MNPATPPRRPDVESWRAEAVINQWSPEHQLIGALMWLTAQQAPAPSSKLVPDTAIWTT